MELYQCLSSEIDFADLAVITSLQIWSPKLLDWINANSDKICGQALQYYGSSKTNDVMGVQDNVINSLNEAFDEAEIKAAEDVLQFLFPRCSQFFKGRISAEKGDELHVRGRIACPDCFKLLSCYCLSEIKIPKGEIKDLLQACDANSLHAALQGYSNNGTLDEFAISLRPLIGEIDLEAYPTIIEAVFRVLGTFDEPDRSILSLPTSTRLEMTTESMMRAIGKERAGEVASATLQKLDPDNLLAFAQFINSMELDQGRYGEKGQAKAEDSWLISGECLDELEHSYVDALKRCSNEINLLERPDSYLALCVWEKLDKPTHDECLTKALAASDKAIAMYVTRGTGRWSDMEYPWHSGWTFGTFPEAFISKEQAILAIERFRTHADFWNLPPQEQEKLATFVLAENCNDADVKISIQDSREALDRWKDEFDSSEGSFATG